MTKQEEDRIRKACGLPVENECISEADYFKLVLELDEGGGWIDDYRRRQALKLNEGKRQYEH